MPAKSASLSWLKQQFRNEFAASTAGTPFSAELLMAIALQESGEIWGPLAANNQVPATIMPLCTGDTLDAPHRSAFPQTKDDLLRVPDGKTMFQIARAALVDLGTLNPIYQSVANHYPDKFCHGYGIFQYDLQHFLEGPKKNFFLHKEWHSLSSCLRLCIEELDAALWRAFHGSKTILTDEDMVYVAIAYNRGSVKVGGGPKQGFRDSSGIYYGENITENLQLAKLVP